MASKGADLIKGFVLGGLIGFAAGILFAPKSGKDTREELLEESEDLIEKAKREFDKIKSDLTDLRAKINQTISRGKSSVAQAQTAEERDFENELNNVVEEAEVKADEKKKNSAKKKSPTKAEA